MPSITHPQDHLLLGAHVQMVIHLRYTCKNTMLICNEPARCLVAAGVKDMNRPAENISIPQNIGEQQEIHI